MFSPQDRSESEILKSLNQTEREPASSIASGGTDKESRTRLPVLAEIQHRPISILIPVDPIRGQQRCASRVVYGSKLGFDGRRPALPLSSSQCWSWQSGGRTS